MYSIAVEMTNVARLLTWTGSFNHQQLVNALLIFRNCHVGNAALPLLCNYTCG